MRALALRDKGSAMVHRVFYLPNHVAVTDEHQRAAGALGCVLEPLDLAKLHSGSGLLDALLSNPTAPAWEE